MLCLEPLRHHGYQAIQVRAGCHRILDDADRSLRAVVSGRTGRPSQLVKAVTYHGLELREEADGFRARIVLDV